MCVVIIDQDELSDWDDSWKLSGVEIETEDASDDETQTASSSTKFMMRINDIVSPGWSKSWLLSAAPPEEYDERQRSWSSCWGYRQQIRWVRPAFHA